MDDRRFDALTRALASGASRRSLLKGLLGGAGAVAGAAVAKQAVTAQITCPSPDGACAGGGGGTIPETCPCNNGAGICEIGGWCQECRIGFNDDCLSTQGAGLCNSSGTNLCQCVSGANGPFCQLLPTTTSTTPDPCPSDFFCGDECCPTSAGYTCCGGQSACCPNERCNNSTSTCCAEGQFPCGESCCANADSCCNGACCSGHCIRDAEPEICCTSGLTCQLELAPDECCPNSSEYTCCGTDGCCHVSQCNRQSTEHFCCGEGTFACGTGDNSCCANADTCTEGQCCPPYGGSASCTGNGGSIPDGCPCGPDASCYLGWCVYEWQECGDNICEGDSECITCVNGQCHLINQYEDCNGGPLEGGGICCGEYCLTLEECCPSTEGNTCTAGDGTIPDGCPCGDGATCHEGYCCFDWQICGDTCCDGDSECIECINGQCMLINQDENCNGGPLEGGGICCGQYCLTEAECYPPTTTTTLVCYPDSSYCYEDEDCCSGCCAESVGIGTPPNKYCLPAEYCSCREFAEPCGLILNGTTISGEAHQLDCCEGLLCLHGYPGGAAAGGEERYCAECSRNSHCEKGYKCCEGWCIPEPACCTDHDCDDCEACHQGSCQPTGVPFGETCGYIINGTQITWESEQQDCCDGLVCCETDKKGNKCFECCGDWDCPKGAECRHGVCEYECKRDKDCPDGTCCCKSGHCSKHCCGYEKPKPPKGGTPDEVNTLPSTGAGPDASSGNVIGTAVLGAAAAYVAAKKLRGDQPEALEATDE